MRREDHAAALGREITSRRLSADGAVVPALLLLTARHLLAHDPTRVLAWRLLHDEALAARASVLGPLLPRPAGELDRDPIALALACAAVALALAYLVAALAGASRRARLALLVVAAVCVVVIPTVAFVAMGVVTGRPYGQDGGVVQLPLAIDRILSGQSPYGADYSSSMLGRQARVSAFWAEHGGNPILRHHAYLPGTHLLMAPFAVVSKAVFGVFDPRVVTLLFFGLAGVLALRLAPRWEHGLCAAAAVWVSPLVYWQQVFGANDVLVAALLLGCAHLARAGRGGPAAALLGLACATKQLAWPFAPFLLAYLSGARSLRDLVRAPALPLLARRCAVCLAVVVAAVGPVAALDFRAFWSDIFVYNAGLAGGDNYPLGGTPGLGLANFFVYRGAVQSLRDHVSFTPLYALLVPIGIWLLREQLRRGGLGDALAAGSAALLLSLYVSRVFHSNYVILAAILLPAALACGAALAADVVTAGLLLVATGIEIAEGEVFAAVWSDARAARWPPREGALAFLAPEAGPHLTRDPLGLALAAAATGLGIAVLVASVLAPRRRWRVAAVAVVAAVVVIPSAWTVMGVGRLSGTPRAQDGWMATVWPRAPGLPPPVLREAWSRSFRQDPPGVLEAATEAPASAAVATVLDRLGARDPRLVTSLGAAPAAIVLTWLVPAFAAVACAPAAILGSVFGSPDLVLVALVVGGLAAASRGRSVTTGSLLGAAVALAPWTVAGVPLWLIVGASGGATRWRRTLAVTAGTGLALSAVGVALGARIAVPSLGPGLGLANLLLYAGTAPGAAAGLTIVFTLAVAAVATWLAARDRWSPIAASAATCLGALCLAPAAAPDAVLLPVALLAVSASPFGIDTPERAP